MNQNMLLLLVLLLITTAATAHNYPHHHPYHRAPASLLARIQSSNPESLDIVKPTSCTKHPTSLRVTPAQFGGDPTGVKDSFHAISTALDHCLNQSKLSPNGNFPGDTSFGNGRAVRDMGGCSIDLDGGEYLISETIKVPEYNANMQLGHGSLVADYNFKGDFLIVIGIEGSCKVPQGSCNIDLNFPALFLDGSHVTSGMQINNVMGVTIGPGGYFLNFTNYGVQINAGHEVMMDRVWMGETNFDFDHEKYQAKPNATAIQINGNDHYILNTIVFSSKIGLEVNGAADYVSGVHVWFPLNHGVHFPDTMAFHVTSGGNRFSGCYIDGGRAVFEEKALQENIWERGFECCQRGEPANGSTGSGIVLIGDVVGPGLQIINNEIQSGTIYHLPSSSLAASLQEDTSSCDAHTFNLSVANADCQGFTQAPSSSAASSLDACQTACCTATGCTAYQWCQDGKCDGATGAGAQCWIGRMSECSDMPERKGWQGFGRSGSSSVSVVGTNIGANSMKAGVKGTKATMTLRNVSSSVWMFNFCNVLLFPTIEIVRVHVVAESGFPNAVARPPKGCIVQVETDVPVTGSITVDVDSSVPSKKFS